MSSPKSSATGSDEHIAHKDALLQEHSDASRRRAEAAAQQKELQAQNAQAKLEARRQRREGSSTPTASSAGEDSLSDAVEIFTSAVKTAEEEWVKVAPEDEPFLHKYAARDLLLKAQTALAALPQTDVGFQAGATYFFDIRYYFRQFWI